MLSCFWLEPRGGKPEPQAASKGPQRMATTRPTFSIIRAKGQFFFFFFFLGPHSRHMEVPRIGVKMEL